MSEHRLEKDEGRAKSAFLSQFSALFDNMNHKSKLGDAMRYSPRTSQTPSKDSTPWRSRLTLFNEIEYNTFFRLLTNLNV